VTKVQPEAIGHQAFPISFSIKNPKIWWPRNIGKPNLYSLRIDILLDGHGIDTIKKRIGLRTIELI
jgi:beta-mannosidase